MVDRKVHPRHFLSHEEKERIVQSIRKAESQTSGEIRVALDYRAKGNVLAHARRVFEKLRMAGTKHRNGVLIFLALKDREFAILGDKGIHEKLGDKFWEEAAAQMKMSFARNEFGAGIEAVIQKTGAELARHFPCEKGDRNELPDKMDEH